VGQKLLKMLPKPLHAGAQAQSYRRGANTGNVYVRGTAVIASGRVTVSSRHTKLQYDAGSLQLNLFTGPAAGNPSIVPTSTTLIVEPYRLDMKLKRTNRDYR
jgi:hypothetical protein